LDFFDSILGSEENERLLQLAYKEMSPDSIAADIVLETLVNPIHLSLRAAILQARPGLQGITAGRCVSSITGQVLHFIRAREILCGLAGENYNDVFIQESINHIIDFSLKGIGEQP
jgi:TetR/AcrR family transcriptional regulator, regulator of cefoperazone and chloramphenicol sensitivity